MIALLKASQAWKGLRADLRSIRNAYFRNQKTLVSRYLASASTPSLHIGAAGNHLPDWLNTDIGPTDRQMMFLDATKPFPIPSGAFDYIHSEHMIEHVPHAAGMAMLRECRRVLKKGGVLRVATPDMTVALGLSPRPSEEGLRYLRWMSESFLPEISSEVRAASVINLVFRGWGHEFIYDETALEWSLRQAGFTDVKRVGYGQSTHERLRGIDLHGVRCGDVEMAMYETMIFEAS
jgi:SAM-dependent methyltransferase